MLTNWLRIGAAGLAAIIQAGCGLYEPAGEARVRVSIPKRATLQAAAAADAREWYRVSVNGPGMAALAVTGEVGARIELQVPSGDDRVFTAELFEDGQLRKKSYAGSSAPVDLQAGQAASVVIEVSRVKRNAAPTLLAASIREGVYYTDSVVTVEPQGFKDEDGDQPQYKYEWLVNGAAVAGQSAASLDGAHFAKGDKVACRVTPSDGVADGAPVVSNAVTIADSLPVVSFVTFPGAPFTVEDDIVASVAAGDADGDGFTLQYAWFVNGEPHAQTSGDTLAAGVAQRGYSVYVVVTPSGAEGAGAPVQSASTIVANAPPVVTGTGISPANPTELTFIFASYDSTSDPDFDETSVEYQWYVNGVPAFGATQAGLGGAYFSHFDEVYALITPYDGADYGLPVSTGSVWVANLAPEVTGVTTTPSGTAFEGNLITAQGHGFDDADGDPAFYYYDWYVNGVSVATGVASIDGALFDKGDSVWVVARPYDGYAFGLPVTSASIAVGNSPPEISALDFEDLPVTAALGASVVATAADPDGDEFSVSYRWFVNGLEVTGATSATLSSIHFARGDSLQAAASADDGQNTGSEVYQSVTVMNALPEAPGEYFWNPVVEDSGGINIVPFDSPFDADGDTVTLTYEWYRDGQLFELGSNPFVTTQLQGGEVWHVVVTPDDGYTTGATTYVGPIEVAHAVAQVSVGETMGCVVTPSDNLVCWGSGYLGDGAYSTQSLPRKIPAFAGDASSVAVGYNHICAITKSGVLKCWGQGNTYGKLGVGDNLPRTTPAQVAFPSGVSGFTQVSAGYEHTCAITNTNAVYCWGYGFYGQLGVNSTANSNAPAVAADININPESDVIVSVAAGRHHSCAATTNPLAPVFCWGSNGDGQAGQSQFSMQELTPAAVVNMPTFGNPAKVVAGEYHSCAILKGNEVHCWGKNQYGQLGDGTTATREFKVQSAIPVGSEVLDLAAGRESTCAIVDLATYCWGRNRNGTLGDGTPNDSAAPVEVIYPYQTPAAKLAAGGWAVCAVSDNQGLSCWGWNNAGVLGDGGGLDFAEPVQTYVQGVAALDAGNLHACAASAGDVWCWGEAFYGQVAAEDPPPYNYFDAVMGGAPATSSTVLVATGNAHTCAVRADATVWCFGDNGDGQLGTGTTGPQENWAVQVAGLPGGADELSLGENFSCARTSENVIKCWGDNSYGQLGLGDFLSPVTWPTELPGYGGFRMLSAGATHVCAIDLGDGLYCWGSNNRGQLGDNTYLDASTPVMVWGEGEAEWVAAGNEFTCAVKRTDNTLHCWGSNDWGKLGTGSLAADAGFPQLVAADALRVAAGDSHACYVDGSEELRCWGDNTYYQLGTTTDSLSRVPAAVVALAPPVSHLALGEDFSCAVDASGYVKCWGSNRLGQVGDRSHRYPEPVPFVFDSEVPE